MRGIDVIPRRQKEYAEGQHFADSPNRDVFGEGQGLIPMDMKFNIPKNIYLQLCGAFQTEENNNSDKNESFQ